MAKQHSVVLYITHMYTYWNALKDKSEIWEDKSNNPHKYINLLNDKKKREGRQNKRNRKKVHVNLNSVGSCCLMGWLHTELVCFAFSLFSSK